MAAAVLLAYTPRRDRWHTAWCVCHQLYSEVCCLILYSLHLLDDLVKLISYTPPLPHVQPALLQTVLTLPPKSTMRLTMDVVKPFLAYTEHPPDAQRGWDLPPAVFVPFASQNGNQTGSDPQQGAVQLGVRSMRMYTPVLLVDLATPDFSMPYNVIIMSCTLIALIFGMVFNLLTRKFVVVCVDEKAP